MTRLTLLLAASALGLAACGERGASDEMRTAEGTANAPGTEVPEMAEPTYEEPEGQDGSALALPRGGDGTAGDYDARADDDMADGPGGDMVGSDGTARTPGIAGGQAQLDPEQESLRDIVQHERRADDTGRDAYRHPVETLEFFGLEPDMTVVEVWPGGGYYTQIIAPFLAEGGGTYYAAGFDAEAGEYQRERLAEFAEEFTSEPAIYGDVNMTVLADGKYDVAPAGMADMVLTFRNVHNWTMGGWSQEAFGGFYDALKPGGVLGVVEHRLPEGADDAMMDSSGYMKQSRVIELAEAAGFELAEASELNANPDDTADHPFGVWTLPPVSRTEGRDGSVPDSFDAQAYLDIGESDRMTLRFVKPLGADGALME